MTSIPLVEASPRSVTGKQVKALRRQGVLPGIIYGGGQEPSSIQMLLHKTSIIVNPLPVGTKVTLSVNGSTETVIIQALQRDIIRGDLTHIDFLRA